MTGESAASSRCPICGGAGRVRVSDVDYDACRRCDGTGEVKAGTADTAAASVPVPLCDEPVTKRAAEWGQELLAAERRVRLRIAREIERQMQTPASDCGCPAWSKRNCGWRAGMGFAADLARDENR